MFLGSRKKAQLVIMLLTISVIVAAIFFTRSGRLYEKCIVDKDAFSEIKASRTENFELLTKICFDDQELFYDGEKGFYLYSLIQGKKNAYNPRISVEGKGGKKLKISVLEDRITDDVLRENKDIAFVVYDDDSFCTGMIKCTSLPILSITSYGDMVSKEDVVGMDFCLFDNRENTMQRTISSMGTIHLRGATSLSNPKNNYRLSLQKKDGDTLEKNKIALLGMRDDEDWILNALYSDPEKVREVFSSELWKKSVGKDNCYGIDTGIEYRYIELFLNGQYYGLYALGYPLQSSQLGIKPTDVDKGLFRKMDHNQDMVYLGDDGQIANYLLQGNQKPSANKLIMDYFVEFDEGYDDKTTYSRISDADNLTDFFLYINLIQGWDNFLKNQNLYLQRGHDGVKALYIPWDVDYSWGVGSDTHAYSIAPSTNVEYKLYDVVYHAFQVDDSLVDLMKEKYKKLRKTSWSDMSVLAMLDRYETEIFESGAFFRDQERWHANTNNVQIQGLTAFKQYVISRLSAMDSYVEEFIPDKEISYLPLQFGLESVLAFSRWPYEEFGQICIIHINDKRIWEESFYQQIMESYGIPEEYISDNVSLKKMLIKESGNMGFEDMTSETDVIVVTKAESMAYGEKFFSGAGTLDLGYGELKYYEGEGGIYGLYLDDTEIMTGYTDDFTYDLRLICIDAESLEVSEIFDYSFNR